MYKDTTSTLRDTCLLRLPKVVICWWPCSGLCRTIPCPWSRCRSKSSHIKSALKFLIDFVTFECCLIWSHNDWRRIWGIVNTRGRGQSRSPLSLCSDSGLRWGLHNHWGMCLKNIKCKSVLDKRRGSGFVSLKTKRKYVWCWRLKF